MNKQIRYTTQIEFLKCAARVFSEGLLILVRWTHSAGSKDFIYFQELALLEAFVQSGLPHSTNIIIFPHVRGEPMIVGQDDICEARRLFHEEDEWLLVEIATPRCEWSHRSIPFNLVGQYFYEVVELQDEIIDKRLFFFDRAPVVDVDSSFEIFIGNRIGAY